MYIYYILEYMSMFLNIPQVSANTAKEQIIHHEIPGKPWEIIGTDLLILYNNNFHFATDYCSKFPKVR